MSIFPGGILQHDNALFYKNRTVLEWLEEYENESPKLSWPPNSTKMTYIPHLEFHLEQ